MPPGSPRNAYMHEAITRAAATRDVAVRDFAELGPVGINWKPAPDRWSVAQCLEHLISSNEAETSLFRAVAEGTYSKRAAERIPLVPRLMGRLARWSMTPGGGVKVRTTQAFEPSSSALPERIVEDFRESVDALLASMEALGHLDHERMVVTSPFSSLVCYRLKDAVLVAIVHLERHRLQAVRVTESEGFPSSADV